MTNSNDILFNKELRTGGFYELAIIDFEVSGQYYIEDLKEPLTNNWETSNFYVGRKYFDLIAPENKMFVKQIETL